ncbi:hypothetical protein ABZ801_03410 [Actinomadura sp. NPDC047616]|uniref:hypothetical protein n=1 Tax=Actinomadura sp. NPDC047616 TaxID=3155914 RepID=UPI0033D60E19
MAFGEMRVGGRHRPRRQRAASLLRRLGRGQEARLEFLRAASLTGNAAERAFLRRRAEEIAGTGPPGPTLGQTVTRFLERDDLDAQTLRSYAQTLRRLCRALGEQTPLPSVTADQVAGPCCP